VDIKNNIKSMDTLIIDKISMLSSKLLEQIQYIFESVRCSACPFGGVQMILSGDFYQLRKTNLIEQKRVFCFICPEIYISSTKKWGGGEETHFNFAPPLSSTAPVK
jgi:hypothetical protein